MKLSFFLSIDNTKNRPGMDFRPGVIIFNIRIRMKMNRDYEVFAFELKNLKKKLKILVFIFELLPEVFSIHEYSHEYFLHFTQK